MRRWVARLLRQNWHLIGALLLLGYFGWHGVHGERGLRAWTEKAQSLDAARLRLAEVEADVKALEGRVASLQPDRADPDLLEEQLRALGYIGQGEVIVMPQPTRRP